MNECKIERYSYLNDQDKVVHGVKCANCDLQSEAATRAGANEEFDRLKAEKYAKPKRSRKTADLEPYEYAQELLEAEGEPD